MQTIANTHLVVILSKTVSIKIHYPIQKPNDTEDIGHCFVRKKNSSDCNIKNSHPYSPGFQTGKK